MPLNKNLEKIVGKRIQAIVVKNRDDAIKRDLLFLIFSDGTCLEFFGDDINNSNELTSDGMDTPRRYLESGQASFEFHSKLNVCKKAGSGTTSS